MCVDLPSEMRSGIGRRRLLAGLGLGAAGVALTGCTPSEASSVPGEARKFAPAPSTGSNTRLVLLGTAGGPCYLSRQ